MVALCLQLMDADGLASVAAAFKVEINKEGWERRVAEQINKYVKPISLAYKDFSKLLSASVGWGPWGGICVHFCPSRIYAPGCAQLPMAGFWGGWQVSRAGFSARLYYFLGCGGRGQQP
jgi:hypothetical protein